MSGGRHRDDIVAVTVIVCVLLVGIVGAQFALFRLFFAWPGGNTWANTIAWLEDGGIALFAVWYFRGHIGKRLAGWWHRHQEPHLAKRDDEMRAHITREVTAVEQRINFLLSEHQGRITDIITRNVRQSEPGIADQRT